VQFGTTHFCEPCHNENGRMQQMEREKRLPPCPCGPLGCAPTRQLRFLPPPPAPTTCMRMPCADAHVRLVRVALPHGTECPIGGNHPPTGEEFALGCGVCRNAQTF